MRGTGKQTADRGTSSEIRADDFTGAMMGRVDPGKDTPSHNVEFLDADPRSRNDVRPMHPWPGWPRSLSQRSWPLA